MRPTTTSFSPRIDEALEAALKLPRLIHEVELRWLGEAASRHQVVIEVGSWCGSGTKMMALMCPGTVYSVDDLTGVDYAPIDQAEVFQAGLADEIASGKVKVIRKPSVAAARDFAVGSADMVFIDAGHTFREVARDIAAWSPVVGAGLLCGHDYNIPGVRQACEAQRDFGLVGVDLPSVVAEGVNTIWARK